MSGATRIRLLRLFTMALAVSFGTAVHSYAANAAEPGFDYEPAFGTEPSFDRDPAFKRSRPAGPARGDAKNTESVLPALDLPATPQSALTGPRLRVTDIRLRGNTVLPEAMIAATVRPYLQRELSPEDLQSVRQALTLLYIRSGYLNSGVLLPDQTVSNGQVYFQAVEGRLVDVELGVDSTLSSAFVNRQFALNESTPLSLTDLETGIRRLELDPLVRRVEGRLLPGTLPGEARLNLQVQENHPLRIIAALDNYESPSVGGERATVTLQHLNLTGRRDVLRASVAATEGLEDYFVSYRVPLMGDRLDLGLYFDQSNSDIIERPLKAIDIESDNKSAGLTLDYHWVDRLDRRVSILSGLFYARSDTELLGQPFSFSGGAVNGKTVSASVSLGIEWVERWGSQLLAARTSIRRGFEGFGSRALGAGDIRREFVTGATFADAEFTVILSQVQWAKRLTYLDSEIVVNAAWQKAFNPLLSVDKFALGGHDTVRGFRENSLLRDNGVYGNLEWRVPVLRGSRWARFNLTATPFFDYGRSRNYGSRLSTSDWSTLSSVGLGVSGTPFRGARAELYYGERLKDDDVVAGAEYDFQDDGIHFSFSYQWSPRR